MDSYDQDNSTASVASIISADDPIVNPSASSSFAAANSSSSSSSSSSHGHGNNSNAYHDLFPPLPATASEKPKAASSWGSTKPAIVSSNVSEVINVSIGDQQRVTDFGESAQASACKKVMAEYSVQIEMSSSKNRSLAIIITGKKDNVAKAKKALLQRLQTQITIDVKVPKEFHKFVLGKAGKTLQTISANTSTKINVPKSEDLTDIIKIQGTRENAERARQEILNITEEKAKQGAERISIPKNFHVFINGPNGNTSKAIMAETGAKLHFPPASSENTEIAISGAKEAVQAAAERINAIYQDKLANTVTYELKIPKKQHRYILGPKGQYMHDLLRDYEVSVELPPADSNSEVVIVRGVAHKAAKALSVVVQNATSMDSQVINAPVWTHKFVIGRGGANIKQLSATYPDVQIQFHDDKETIELEGSPAQLELVKSEIGKLVADTIKKMLRAEVQVPHLYHKHIIGKNGQNVNRIKEANNVIINFPSDDDTSSSSSSSSAGAGAKSPSKSDIIIIEGEIEGVNRAREEIILLAKKLADLHSEDVKIDQKFHKAIIGARGQNIRSISDQFSGVLVNFPEQDQKSDVVTIKGPKQAVLQAKAHLEKVAKDLISQNYTIELPIFKKFHKNVIGKNGVNIKKIKEETDTKITIPDEDNDNDSIVIIGKKENVESAKAKILAIQNELASIVTVELAIPPKSQAAVHGVKGRNARSISEECGGVSIIFPGKESAADKKAAPSTDKVLIRGPAEDVEKAKQLLQQLAADVSANALQTREMKVKKQYHKFISGRGSSGLRQIQESTHARVILPGKAEEDSEVIALVGKESAVKAAEDAIKKIIQDLESVVTEELHIEHKYHKIFLANKAKMIKDICEEFGNVNISFPKSGKDEKADGEAAAPPSSASNPDTITLKGGKEFVESAKQRMLEVVEDHKLQITKEIKVPSEHHRVILGRGGSNIRPVCDKFNVQVKFPEHNNNNNKKGGDDSKKSGTEENSNSEDTKVTKNASDDVIKVTGRQEKVDQAIEAIMALVPAVEEVKIPADLHGSFIGAGGKELKKFSDEFDVGIKFPSANSQSDSVTLKGTADKLASAKEYISKRLEELEKDQAERELRNFTVEFDVDAKYHSSIIGKAGSVIQKIKDTTDTRINFPKPKAEKPNTIVIKGLQEKAEAAKAAILKIVQDLENQTTSDVDIDPRVHRRLISLKAEVKKISDDNQVYIKFPNRDSQNEKISIRGTPEGIEKATAELKALAEEHMSKVLEEEENREIERQHIRDPRHYEMERERNRQAFFGSAASPDNNGNNTSRNNRRQQSGNPTSSDFPSFVNTSAQNIEPPLWVRK